MSFALFLRILDLFRHTLKCALRTLPAKSVHADHPRSTENACLPQKTMPSAWLSKEIKEKYITTERIPAFSRSKRIQGGLDEIPFSLPLFVCPSGGMREPEQVMRRWMGGVPSSTFFYSTSLDPNLPLTPSFARRGEPVLARRELHSNLKPHTSPNTRIKNLGVVRDYALTTWPFGQQKA